MKRLYHIKLKSSRRETKSYLVEARSQEQAIQLATKPLIVSVTIPTPLEAFKLQSEGATIISDSVQPAGSADQQPSAEDGGAAPVGRLGLENGEDDADQGERHDVTAGGAS